jgi:hypothetical protein
MTKRIAALILAIAVTLPLSADFASIARAIDSQRGVKRIWIPFLGVARVLVRMVEPNGVQDFQLATFEGVEHVDPKALAEIVRTQAGPGFRPLVQAWSRRSKEWSFVYVRPSQRGDEVELMILAHDREDTVLVRVNVDAALIARELQFRPGAVASVRAEVGARR